MKRQGLFSWGSLPGITRGCDLMTRAGRGSSAAADSDYEAAFVAAAAAAVIPPGPPRFPHDRRAPFFPPTHPFSSRTPRFPDYKRVPPLTLTFILVSDLSVNSYPAVSMILGMPDTFIWMNERVMKEQKWSCVCVCVCVCV
jgi:hypothetical protein